MAIAFPDYSYIGSGSLLIREFGSAAPFVPVGNCSELKFSPQDETKSLTDFTQPGGNKRAEVRRLSGVDLSFTFTDFSAENFARGLRADVTTIGSGTETGEAVVAYKGGYTPLAKIAATITSVVPHGGGTAYTAGTDYQLIDGQFYIPSTSTIPDPSGGAANIDVTYTYTAQKRVEALTSPNKQYELLFVGLNEAHSGRIVRVQAYKCSASVIAELSLIGEDFGAGTISGSLLPDGTRTGAGISQYFVVEELD